MRFNANFTKGMRICITFLIIMCFPLHSNAQFWKKWFRKKKKPKVEVVTPEVPKDTVEIVSQPENVDTVVNLVAYMPDDVKTDSLSPFSDFITARVNDKIVNVNGVQFKMIGVQ